MTLNRTTFFFAFICAFLFDFIPSKSDTYIIETIEDFINVQLDESRHFIINESIDLEGKTLVLPANSILQFSKNAICYNGALDLNGSTILADSIRIFKNVKVLRIGNPSVPSRWFLGKDRLLSAESFSYLPNSRIDFNNTEITCKDSVFVEYASWQNLILSIPYLRVGFTAVKSELCERHSEDNSRINIHSSRYGDYTGLIASVKSSIPVHYDCRPLNGIPTLYKGVTSVVEAQDGKTLYLRDSIDYFPLYNHYQGATLSSVVTFHKPTKASFYNCSFTLLPGSEDICGNVYIVGAKDILFDSCSFHTYKNKGSRCLLGINDSVGGLITHCSVSDSYYEGTITSYGIQLFGSSDIIIEDCFFENNRRGVDFSGTHESRYNVVKSCTSRGQSGKEGSGFGSHSTSSYNSFINNLVEGNHSRGIYVRGEHELVKGNVMRGMFSAAYIVTGCWTSVEGNQCYPILKNEITRTFIWQENVSGIDNTLVVKDNTAVFSTYFIRGLNGSVRLIDSNNVITDSLPPSILNQL